MADPGHLAGTLSNNTSTAYSITVPDDALGPVSLGAATLTVANLNQIKVIEGAAVGEYAKTVWQYSSGSVVSNAIAPLLLGN